MRPQLGITATRQKLTDSQELALRVMLSGLDWDWVHHGDCVGGDARAHEIAEELGRLKIHVHPPSSSRLRAFKVGHEMSSPATYAIRNQAIVDAATHVLALPAAAESISQRSGTWQTVRMAKRAEKPYMVVYPDGRWTKSMW